MKLIYKISYSVFFILLFNFYHSSIFAFGWDDKEDREKFIKEDVIIRKQACDKTFHSYSGGLGSEMITGSHLYIECLRSLVNTSVYRLYKEDDIDEVNFTDTLKNTEANLIKISSFVNGQHIFCDFPLGNQRCDYGAGSYDNITPYGPIIDFYRELIFTICSRGASTVVTDEWKKQYSKFENYNTNYDSK